MGRDPMIGKDSVQYANTISLHSIIKSIPNNELNTNTMQTNTMQTPSRIHTSLTILHELPHLLDVQILILLK